MKCKNCGLPLVLIATQNDETGRITPLEPPIWRHRNYHLSRRCDLYAEPDEEPE